MTASQFQLLARAWCRVDFAGGTLDIWPLGLLHPGAATINVAIDCAVTVRFSAASEGLFTVEQGASRVRERRAEALRARPETALVGLVAEAFDLPPFACRIDSGSPTGGGLGASSALTVALIRGARQWSGREPLTDRQVMTLARDLEAGLMELPTGIQDHAAALLGGALELTYPAGGPALRPLEGVDLGKLGDRLVLVYSGQSHFSAGNNWQVVRRRLDGEPEVRSCFDGLAETAREMAVALDTNRFETVGELMTQEWSFRRRLAPGISTPVVESLLTLAEQKGAWGGKACGAGGGGCLAILCPPEVKAPLEALYTAEGYEVIHARPTARALEIER